MFCFFYNPTTGSTLIHFRCINPHWDIFFPGAWDIHIRYVCAALLFVNGNILNVKKNLKVQWNYSPKEMFCGLASIKEKLFLDGMFPLMLIYVTAAVNTTHWFHFHCIGVQAERPVKTIHIVSLPLGLWGEKKSLLNDFFFTSAVLLN